MRARVYSNGGSSTGGFTFNGGTLTGALILAGNPSEPLEAASKQYLDSSLVNLNASNISSGILPSGRLPTFVGDLVKPAGSSTINLAPIGVTAGDYIKPTVDAKGRVTGGSSLVEADIPNLSWNKVATNRPTTLSGYGINNAIPLSGGTLTGFLSFNGSVTGNLQAVTKQYIDTTLSSASGISIGDVIRKPYTTTPPGFLKCNGGEVDKTTYNALYATIGDRFSKNTQASLGKPWCRQYRINEVQNKDINNWIAGTALPTAWYASAVIVTKNRVYLLSGWNGSSWVATTYTALINADGTLTGWVTGTSLPGALGESQAIIVKNRIYLLGGYSGSGYVGTVYTAPINADGTIGTWVAGTSLPDSLGMSQAIVTSSKVYVLGGYNGSAYVSTVYVASISSDGILGSWATGTALPTILSGSQLICTNNRVYLLGGYNGSGGTSNVYTTTINTDGTLGTWVTANSLPGPLTNTQAFTTKERVYLFGGHNGTTYVSTVYTASINADGTLGTWAAGTSLPDILSTSQFVSTKNRIYLLGGYNSGGYTNTVYTAVISGGLNDYSSYYAFDSNNYMTPGSGKPWTQQYQVNTAQSADITGWVSTTTLPVALAYSNVLVTKNRIYLCGGYVNSSTATANVYTAPINADGSLGTWTSGTALPAALGSAQILVAKNRAYLIGGYSGSSTATVYIAAINSDGTLGTWTAGTAIPGTLSYSSAFITKNRIYIGGGITGSNTFVSTLYTAVINNDGTLGTWSITTALPVTIGNQLFITTKNCVYMVGGNSGNTYYNSVYVATINSDGLIGTWTVTNSLPGSLASSQGFISKNRIYVFGGYSGNTTLTNAVYTASINTDGTVGTWSSGTALPGTLGYSQLVATKNHIYLLGGLSAVNTMTSTVYMASILDGLNDYTQYYDGTIVAADAIDTSTTFALPDLSTNEKFDTVSYIKY